jgi:hypothetical protein
LLLINFCDWKSRKKIKHVCLVETVQNLSPTQSQKLLGVSNFHTRVQQCASDAQDTTPSFSENHMVGLDEVDSAITAAAGSYHFDSVGR